MKTKIVFKNNKTINAKTKWFLLISIYFFIFNFNFSGASANTLKNENSTLNNKNVITDKKSFKSEFDKKNQVKKWSISFGYSVNTNIADEKSNKLYNHEISTRFGYKILDLSLGAKTGYRYQSINTEINDGRRSTVSTSLLSQGWNYELPKFNSVKSSLSQNFSYIFFSPEFQRTGSKGSVSIGLGVNNQWTDLFSSNIGLSYSKNLNDYEYPQSGPGYNIDQSWSSQWGVGFNLLKSLNLGGGIGWSKIYSMDQISHDEVSYYLSLGYKINNITTSLSYSEGDSLTEESIAYLLSNDRQKTLVLNLGWGF